MAVTFSLPPFTVEVKSGNVLLRTEDGEIFLAFKSDGSIYGDWNRLRFSPKPGVIFEAFPEAYRMSNPMWVSVLALTRVDGRLAEVTDVMFQRMMFAAFAASPYDEHNPWAGRIRQYGDAANVWAGGSTYFSWTDLQKLRAEFSGPDFFAIALWLANGDQVQADQFIQALNVIELYLAS